MPNGKGSSDWGWTPGPEEGLIFLFVNPQPKITVEFSLNFDFKSSKFLNGIMILLYLPIFIHMLV